MGLDLKDRDFTQQSSCEVVVFLITPYYGSLMEICTLKENCNFGYNLSIMLI